MTWLRYLNESLGGYTVRPLVFVVGFVLGLLLSLGAKKCIERCCAGNPEEFVAPEA